MNVARPLRIIATIAAVVAAALGLGTYTHPNYTDIHMIFGLIVALALLIVAVLAVFSNGSRGLGVIGIVYAFLIPIFGTNQELLLVGDLHWLIETTHLAFGFGAVALIGVIGARLKRRKTMAGAASPAA